LTLGFPAQAINSKAEQWTLFHVPLSACWRSAFCGFDEWCYDGQVAAVRESHPGEYFAGATPVGYPASDCVFVGLSLAESKLIKHQRSERISFMNHQLSIAQTFTTRTCKRSPRRLYHVTPVHNLISIHERGVDPEFSKSHPERIYFVEYRCLHWAIPFIAKKHGCSVEELIVFKAHGTKGCKSLGAGKWYASRPKRAQFFDVAVNHVK
jgi:hypothetical protein